MSNIKISQLTELSGSNVDPTTDVLPIVDTDGNVTKKITVAELTSKISGSLYVSGSIIPDGSEHHDLGSIAHPWKDIYFSDASLKFVSASGVAGAITLDADGAIDLGNSPLRVSGSATITGSLRVTGSLVDFIGASGVTGSFSGDGSGITGVVSASYAVSASYEIIKEVSSSHADTASFAQSGDGIFSGSFSGSYVGDGSTLTGIASGLWTGSNGNATRESDVEITGSLTVTSHITASGNISSSGIYYGDGSGLTSVFEGTTASSSISTRITTNEIVTDKTLVSGSSQIDEMVLKASGSFSGSFQGDGSSLTNIPASGVTGLALNKISSGSTHITTYSTGIIDVSGSLMKLTGSLDVTGYIKAPHISGSFSGSFEGNGAGLTNVFEGTSASSSISTRLSSAEVITAKTLVSSSAQIASAISGAFTPVNTGSLGSTTITGSLIVSGAAGKVADFTGLDAISGSIYSGSTYYGDGSNLTGIVASNWTGSADGAITRESNVQITGSMSVTGSVDFIGPTTIAGSLTVGTNSNYDDFIVNGGTIHVSRGGLNILRDYTSAGWSSGGSVILGYRAMGSSAGKNQSVAIGRKAGLNHGDNSDYATFIGYAAGGSAGTGDADQSTMIGAEAGYNAKNPGNTFLGYRAGFDIANGTNNLIIGHYAASGSGDISSQLRIGSGSLAIISASLVTGDVLFPNSASATYITASRIEALSMNVTHFTASFITASTIQTSGSNIFGDEASDTHTFIGNIIADNNITASGWVSASSFIGDGSSLTGVAAFPFVGDAVITGSLLISGSGQFRMDSDDVILGANAGALLDSDTDSYNVFIGADAGATVSTGIQNVAIGQGAMSLALSGATYDVCIGYLAGRDMQGNYNVAIGRQAMMDGTSGNQAVAIGYRAGEDYQSTGGIFIGSECVPNGTSMAGGTHIGNLIGYSAADIGTSNVLIGQNVCRGGSSATIKNVVIGTGAGYNLRGTNNVIIGTEVCAATLTGDDNIFIGYDFEPGNVSDQVQIGNATTALISGSLVTGDVLFPSTASAAYFSGDGSNLTGIASDPFPYSGSAIISSSYTGGDTTSNTLKVMGSGSVSGSALFDVVGSVGTVFSVTDGLTGTLFEANNISGLPVIQAKSDNTVHLGKWGGYGITISGSTPDPTNPSAKISITGSTYFSGSVADFSQVGTVSGLPAAFPFIGDAVITGSLLISGSHALQLDTVNVVLGAGAGAGMTAAATNNVIIGTNAGNAGLSGDKNVFIGEDAGGSVTSGNYSVYIGHQAGSSEVDSYGNVAIGYWAGKADAGTGDNVSIGYAANFSNASTFNTVIGSQAGGSSSTGRKTAVGGYACLNLTSDGNVGIGYKAMGHASAGAGAENVAIGEEALYGGTGGIEGSGNIAAGFNALKGITTGGQNIAIGWKAGDVLTTGTGNIIIGYDVDPSANSATGELRIGSGSVIPLSASLSTGDVLFPSTASAAYFSGDGSQLTNLPSSSPFPLSGSAIISSSFTSGDTDSNALLVMGSGSVSGSALFEVQGQNTTLFSVTDDLTDELFAANDASGLSIISAFADRTVKLGKPGGFGIVISGSDPMPTDAAARIEISGSTYFTGTEADFSNVTTITGNFPASTAAPVAAFVNSWFMG